MTKLDVEALKSYIAARDALKEGDESEAAALFENSVGSQPDNTIIRENIHSLLNLESPIGRRAVVLLKEEQREGKT